jgi:hypothetical protein
MQAWKVTHIALGGTRTKTEKRTRKRRTVTNLINRLLLIARQVSLPVGGIFLEEVANFVTRRKEVVVTDMVFVSSGEFRLQQIADMKSSVMRIW